MEPKLVDPGQSDAGWHMHQAILQCPFFFGKEYRPRPERQDDPNAPPPLIKGSLMHLALAQFYRRMQALQEGTNPDEWERPLRAVEHKAETVGGDWPSYIQLIQQATKAYVTWWHPEKGITILRVEKQLRARIKDEERECSYLFTLRGDLIIRDRYGRHWIIDHKTTYAILPKTIRQYMLSGQFLGYRLFGQKLWGGDFGGVLLNMLRLRGNFEFARPVLESAHAALTTFKKTLIYANRLMVDIPKTYGDNTDDWPRACHEFICYGKYGPCKGIREGWCT